MVVEGGCLFGSCELLLVVMSIEFPTSSNVVVSAPPFIAFEEEIAIFIFSSGDNRFNINWVMKLLLELVPKLFSSSMSDAVLDWYCGARNRANTPQRFT